MSHNKIQLCCGILLCIMPFLGFPEAWKTIFYVLIGILFIILAGIGYFKRRSQTLHTASSDAPFVEHVKTEPESPQESNTVEIQ